MKHKIIDKSSKQHRQILRHVQTQWSEAISIEEACFTNAVLTKIEYTKKTGRKGIAEVKGKNQNDLILQFV